MLTFHAYGFLIGTALVVTVLLMEAKARQAQFSLEQFWRLVLWAGVGAAVGARAYHVWTDWHLYAHDWAAAFMVWRGGLSILGAGLGGVTGVGLAVGWTRVAEKLKLSHGPHPNWRLFADIAVFGVPFGQAIGRLGNFVNQELYGPPSHLPWAIFIDPAHRLPGYQQFAYFQPLFAYELVCTAGFGMIVWWFYRGGRRSLISNPYSLVPGVGTGQLFLTYALFYCVVRFLLDFLRLDKAAFGLGLGLNQVVLLVIILVTLVLWWRNRQQLARMKT